MLACCLTWHVRRAWAPLTWDGDAEQVEGLALGAGGLGEHRHVGGGAGEPDLVAGEGGQVLEQAAEACGRGGRLGRAGMRPFLDEHWSSRLGSTP